MSADDDTRACREWRWTSLRFSQFGRMDVHSAAVLVASWGDDPDVMLLPVEAITGEGLAEGTDGLEDFGD
ncbi:hypothetical protein VB005_00000 [Metarhizium brunneum]